MMRVKIEKKGGEKSPPFWVGFKGKTVLVGQDYEKHWLFVKLISF